MAIRAARKTPFSQALLIGSLSFAPSILALALPQSMPVTVLWMSVPVVFARFEGFAASMASVMAMLSIIFGSGMVYSSLPESWVARLPPVSAASVPALLGTLGFCAIAAFSGSRSRLFRDKLLARFRDSVHRAGNLQTRNVIFEKVNQELKLRVSAQRDSITMLHDKIRKLPSLDLHQALDTILETISMFTGMTRGAIWSFDADQKYLVPLATRGWKVATSQDVLLDPDTSIEGYVLRNRTTFSVRMTLESQEFDRFELRDIVIAMPIIIDNRTWGVLDVEDLPFERYSNYTETILDITISLARPYLRQILEYEKLNDQAELDKDTGFPLYSILYRALEDELERSRLGNDYISLVIIEMSNFDLAVRTWGLEQAKKMLFGIKDQIGRAHV